MKINTGQSKPKSSLAATVKLLLTAMIWASTFVLAQIAVEKIGPMTLAGIRFFLAGLALLAYLKVKRFDFSTLKGNWLQLFALGLLSFTIGNAATYYALQYLPSTTVSLLMNFVTPFVLMFGIIWLKEIPRPVQYAGIGMALGGTVIYFYPQHIPVANPGFIVLVFGLLGFAGYTILGRYMARNNKVHYLAQTAFPLLFGGAVLLVMALIWEGVPTISARIGFILVWLIAINTILGYILYNQAIAHLEAIQINIILNLSPFFTAILAFFLLGQRISPRQIIAMLIILTGTYLVQSKPEKGTVKVEEEIIS